MTLYRWGIEKNAAVVDTDESVDFMYLTPYLDIASLGTGVRLKLVPGGEDLIVGNFLYGGAPSPRILSKKARSALAEFLDPNGDLTPVEVEGIGEYFAFSPRKILDIIDVEKSKIRKTTHLSIIDEAVFLPVEVPDSAVFLAKGFENQEIWVTESFVRAVRNANLEGADFF